MESKGYICPQCKVIYSSLDVSRLLNVRTGSFDCEICPDSELQTYDPMLQNSINKTAAGPHELHSRLMEQTRLIVELLKKADDITIPAFIPSAWLDKNSSKYSMLTDGDDGDGKGGPQLAIAGANAIETKVNVSVELSDEATLRAASGSVSTPLPEWHMYSTITGEAIRLQNSNFTSSTTTITSESKGDVIDIAEDDQDDIASYYTQMAEEEPSPKLSKLQETLETAPNASSSSSNPTVFVAGKPVPLDQLTEGDKDKMTEEEYSQ